MNYLLHASLSCCLAISSTTVMAAENTKNPLVASRQPAATVQTLPSVHATVGGSREEANQQVSLEGFWPFFRQEQQVLFLQGGWQRQQQRNLLSLGLGWRYLPESHWGLGCHVFYDQDTTQQQQRLGLGAEAWWQSLKLAVNGYLPASSWRAAREVAGYQQRPASGYDVTLQGYLPALPQIGASVRYAHYFGDEVTLGGVQQRYRNPQQWRWGVDVTPIPLLTLAYHRQAGLSGQSKHQFSAVLNYRFALPLSQQLDPHQVTLLHSAERQPLARVLREQLMALKYAKIATPTVKSLPTPEAEPKAGPEGEQNNLNRSRLGVPIPPLANPSQSTCRDTDVHQIYSESEGEIDTQRWWSADVRLEPVKAEEDPDISGSNFLQKSSSS
ncbi:inverse autotransporter beta domain-containing protein [unidentified bacterial endosymbiont]|uniref:inverse autotransporter beta domain-containing protein n=1 Tax=unidentified bacterial endosymbiont TaxID=2355 RepID=UPI00209D154F|nr:inverse autotransporter beta domain-containing protein [unidentified bacterial endosymbiont]